MNPTSKDIAMLLADLTKPVTPNPEDPITSSTPERKITSLVMGSNLFIGKEPQKPPFCVTIFDTPPWRPGINVDGTSTYERPSVQIRVRNANYETGMLLAQDIVHLLHGKNNFTQGSTEYMAVTCVSTPALLDWDENTLARIIINFDIQRRN